MACERTGECQDTGDGSTGSPRVPDASEEMADHHEAGRTDGAMTDATSDGASRHDGSAEANKSAPRPIAPLSTSRVTTRTPTLHWALPKGVTDATVDFCLDRACAKPIGAPAHVTGSSYAPTGELPIGVVYWRLHPSTSTSVTSPTWQFTVGAQSAPVDASWGTSLDVNGDGYGDLVVGAPGMSSFPGNVYVYLGGPSGLGNPTALRDPENASGDSFGRSVASAGDVNGDGYADLVVGAPGVSEFKGSVYIYLGGPSGLAPTSTPLSDPGEATGDSFGISVSSAGDVNGDGYADLVVGASGSEGNAYVYLGGPSGLGATPTALRDPGNSTGDSFGISVAGAGDVNGDGYADLVVGAPGISSSAGGVYVYLGGPSGIGAIPTVLNDPGNIAGDLFGASVASAGDANGDGYSDIVVGAQGVSSGTGSAYVYYGAPSGVGTTPTPLNDPRTTPGDAFGVSVANAGDVNGDGYVDLVVGADGVSSGAGDAYIFLGGPPSPLGPLVAALADPGQMAADRFGISVASAGDVNGDGYADLVVGADGVSSSSGGVDVYLGGTPALGAAITLANPGPTGGQFGASVFGASN
jgi:hypothetical protein